MMKLKSRRRHISFEDRMSKLQQPQLRTGTYYYVWAQEGGKRYLLGPFNSEDEANSTGYEKLDCEFEVVSLNTSDRNRANSIMKARSVNKSKTLAEATRHVRHEGKGIDY